MRKIVALIGVPGTGKSTLTRQFMADFADDWKRVEIQKLVPSEFSASRNLHVLGKYDEGETFPGTDKLSMAAQPQAMEFLTKNPDVNVFFEGDRLGTQSFFEFIADLPDTEFVIIKLESDERTLDIRYKQRGSDQSEQFLRGRQTKIEGICKNFLLMDYITDQPHETTGDTTRLVNYLVGIFE